MRKLLLAFSCAALCCGQAYTSYNNQPVARVSFLRSQLAPVNALGDSSLVLYMPMNGLQNVGPFLDLSGNGRVATITNAANGYYPGKIGPGSPYFNKSRPNTYTVSPTTTLATTMTFSAWVSAQAPLTSSSYQRIIDTDYKKEMSLMLTGSGNQFVVVVNNSSLSTCAGGTVATSSSAWQMVTAVYDGTYAYLYVNGSLVIGGSSAGTNCQFSISGATFTNALTIGSCANSAGGECSTSSGGSGNWDGRIQGVRVYTRALSASEIAAIYSAENH